MRIQFCGADRTVTGSCHLIEINGLRLLLDCGMYQGPRQTADELNHWLPPNAKSVDAVILSHGHLDHCGKLPVLTNSGYSGPIYCTPATSAVARVVLQDAAQIQEENAEYLNRRSRGPGDPPVKPLYRIDDIGAVTRLFKFAGYGKKTDLGKGASFTFFDAGHILGSAYVWIEWQEQGRTRTLLFTADVGRYNTPILRDPQDIPGPAEIVITESTYGTVSHGPMSDVEPQLLEAVKSCIERRSRLIVPSFALGRTQTILWYMQKFVAQKQIPSIPLFVDSPMGTEISKVHTQFPDAYDDETKKLIGQNSLFGLSNVTFAVTAQDSRRINMQTGACVIVASSPTCEFGRVLHHLTISADRPNDLVIFVGWVPPGTLGRRLQDGQKRVRILDRWYDVQFQVRTIHGLSAHADGDELLRFLKPTLGPGTSFNVVHGDVDRAEGFAQRLMAAGAKVALVPAMESSLVSGEVSGNVRITGAPTGGGGDGD